MRISHILKEAPRRRVQQAPSIDTTAFKPQIIALMRQFADVCQLRFKRDWADLAQQQVAQKKAAEELAHAKYYADREAESDAEPFEFDTQEYVRAAVNQIWQRNTLYQVRANIAHEHDEYQTRAAERHGYDDDNNTNYIESSDYLSGMSAMERCAQQLERVDLADPRAVPVIVQSCKSFLADWSRHENPSDGGEGPILDEDFTTSVERLLPLLLLIY